MNLKTVRIRPVEGLLMDWTSTGILLCTQGSHPWIKPTTIRRTGHVSYQVHYEGTSNGTTVKVFLHARFFFFLGFTWQCSLLLVLLDMFFFIGFTWHVLFLLVFIIFFNMNCQIYQYHLNLRLQVDHFWTPKYMHM